MVTYATTAGGDITAYLVRPDEEGKFPAIVLIHEIFGLNDHIKDVANRIANEGYVVLAPHLYSFSSEISSVFSEPNVATAMRFMNTLQRERMRDGAYVHSELEKVPAQERETVQRVMGMMFGGLPMDKLTTASVDGVGFLKSLEYVDREKIGTVGFCFGGSISINTACSTNTAACIIFYGNNPDPIDKVEKIQCPVMGLYGADDARINADLDKLVAAMARYKKDFEMKIYPGAAHAFFNNTNKHLYNKPAAKDAWSRMRVFLKRALK